MVGIAGSVEKCKWLVDELGFDEAVNYESSSFTTKLREATPNGVNCYFDNVGKNTDLDIYDHFRLYIHDRSVEN